MKYRFTGKEKKAFGRTLKQIVCVTAFSSVSAGDSGGWIESEKNLSQDGDAWVYGNARVYGDAEVCTKKAFTISTNHHHVTVTDTHITVGCQNHPIDFWKKATKADIIDMDGNESAEAWFKYRDFILSLEAERNG